MASERRFGQGRNWGNLDRPRELDEEAKQLVAEATEFLKQQEDQLVDA